MKCGRSRRCSWKATGTSARRAARVPNGRPSPGKWSRGWPGHWLPPTKASRDGRAYRERTGPGLAAAERLWNQGWYCGRCARTHFEGEGAALTLQEFRVRVWTAGGYGDLAETYPAVDLTVARRPDGSY